jgi:hypothetical protein
MKAKDKAKELVDRYAELSIVTTYNGNDEKEISKQCALIAVDEILTELHWRSKSRCDYWQEVKQEIEKL